jgi:outer membrane protein TolC
MNRLVAMMTIALGLTGCATVNIDQELGRIGPSVPAAVAAPQPLVLARDEAGRRVRADLAQRLLSAPLSQDDAVRLALVHSPAVQAQWAQVWADLAQAGQSGRIRNPVLAFERVVMGSELEIGRALSFGLLDLLTWPQRQTLARQQQAQVRLQAAGTVVDTVVAVRQAWVRAVAAQQVVGYAAQVQQAADASAELARRMQQAGNFNRLQHARQHAFYADATGRMAAAQQAALASREALVRLLGLDEAQARRLQLPARLPELPLQPRSPESVAGAARDQRLDWQMARLGLEQAGRAQRLDLLQSLVDVEVTHLRPSTLDRADGHRTRGQGWELAVPLPVFDWGTLRAQQADAQVLAAAYRYDAVVAAASSHLRESYAAYRHAWSLARHWRDEVVPLRKTISEENLLRYNGMLIGVFELLADTREQISAVMSAIEAQQQFWLADAALSAALVGRPGPAAAMVPGLAAGAGTAAPASADPGH